MTNLGIQRFSDIYTEVGNLVKDVGTTRRTVIKDAINRAYDFVSTAYEWPQLVVADSTGLRKGDESTLKTLESGEALFPLPMAVGRLKGLLFQDQSNASIDIVESGDLFELAGSQLATTGKPNYVAQVDQTAQFRALSAAGAVTAYSSSSNNDNTQTVRVKYRRSDALAGEAMWEDVSGTFSTGVALNQTAAADYPIEMVSVPAAWVGNFEIRDSSSNKLVIVPSIERPETASNSQYQIVSMPLYRAWRVPDIDYPLTVLSWRRPLRMTEDEDVPEIPVASYLVEKAAAEVLRQRGKPTRAGPHESEAVAYLRAAIGQHSNAKRTVIRPARGSILQQSGRGRWRR